VYIVQGDQKVSVRLMITIQSSGAQKLFWSLCISVRWCCSFMGQVVNLTPWDVSKAYIWYSSQ